MADLRSIEPQNPAEDVIPILERALERAREGKISAVGIAFVYRNGNAGAMWSMLPSTLMMLAAIERLKHKVNQVLDETVVDGGEAA